MPLIVGIEDKEKSKMFDDEERRFLASFEMGMYAMHTGIGDIGDKEYITHKVSVDEAVERFKIVFRVFNFDTSGNCRWLLDKDFVQKMADAEWSCNVNNESQEEFLHKMKNILFNEMWDEVKPKHLKKPREIYWRDAEQQRKTVNHIIGSIHTGETCYFDDFQKHIASELIEAFYQNDYEIYDMPLYHNRHNTAMYLRWNDDNYEYYLSDKTERQEEEE